MTMLTGSFLLQDLTKMPPSLLISSKKISVIGRHLSVSVEKGPVSDKVVPRTIGSVQEPILATAGVAKAARQPTRQAAANFIDFLPIDYCDGALLALAANFSGSGRLFHTERSHGLPIRLIMRSRASANARPICSLSHGARRPAIELRDRYVRIFGQEILAHVFV